LTICLALAGFLVTGCKPARKSLTEAEAQSERLACAFDAGAMPEETLAGDAPRGDQIPIDHIILIMQENRSFDHYLSLLPGANVASPDVQVPGPDGGFVQRFHTSTYCVQDDVNHSWDGVHQEIDDGGMDGFAIANADAIKGDPNGARSMGYLDSTDLPFYYSLAETFAVSDSHFCSAPGDTAPNREYFAAASSRGAADETIINLPQKDANGNQLQNIYSLVDGAHISWRFYSAGVTPQFGSFAATNQDFATNYIPKLGSLQDFYNDLQAGTLPSVAFVDEATNDQLTSTTQPNPTCLSNEHPTENPQLGQKFIANVVNALLASPNWKSSALFVTWDEHGGFYDHVYPPHACPPDDYPPMAIVDMKMVPQQGAFDQYGVRVPLFVVSPYVKRGYVSHVVTDHTSLLRFIEAKFNLPALTRRDANAAPPFDMFDFQHPDFSKPTLAEAVVDDPTKHGCGALPTTCTFGNGL
jgi:phospholipase C